MKKEIFLNNMKDVLEQNEDYVINGYEDRPENRLLAVQQKNIKESTYCEFTYWYRHKSSFDNIYYANIYAGPYLVFKNNTKPIYEVMKKFNGNIDFFKIENIINFYKEKSNKFSYFKKIEMTNYFNLTFDDLFTDDKNTIKDKFIGYSYYAGLSKNVNLSKKFDFKSSPIKISLCVISINNTDLELGLVMTLPMLSNLKFEGLLALTGSEELKDKLHKDFIEKFNEYFRNNIMKIIIKKNKLKGQEKKDLLNISDEELAVIYEIAEMQHI